MPQDLATFAASFGGSVSESDGSESIRSIFIRFIGRHGKGAEESASPDQLKQLSAHLRSSRITERSAASESRISMCSNCVVPSASPYYSVQPQYSPRRRRLRFPYVLSQRMGVIAFSNGVGPVDQGGSDCCDARRRLAKGQFNFQEPLLSRNLRLVEKVPVGQRHGASLAEVAIAWT
jgi:aryl-alcohol dehydrogenase-like predicted oxidoreductase